MISFPNCKINLGLYIEQKRDDGFHNIKTIFYPISLCDALEIVVSQNTTEMSISGIPVECDLQSNLCMKAYESVKKDFGLPPVKIHLHKAIPNGAGLGGGSSDAAFTIKLLNNLFSLSLSNNIMEKYASELGSDCAFFINNSTVIASGKGNVFEDIPLAFNGFSVIIIKPPIHVSTSVAYQFAEPRNETVDIKTLINQPISKWKDSLINDFEKSVFKKFPEIEDIKARLYQNGAEYAAMSGSGSSVFGIFKKDIPKMNFPENYFVWKGLMI